MSKTILTSEIITIFEQWAPKHVAYSWDNVGLQVGTLNKEISKIMVTLDVLENVVDEAIAQNVDLIIAHHPILFKPLKQIDTNEYSGRIVSKLIKNDITVYAAHTNLDLVHGGVSDLLADKLGVHDTEVLVPSEPVKLFKLVVYVPESHESVVTEAIGNAGAGHIGNYSHCTFQSIGTGAFMPLPGTDPFIGKQEEIVKVKEVKVETIVPEGLLSNVLRETIDSHPYEEVAYDIISLANTGPMIGAGRIGSLKESMSLREFCEVVKKQLDVPALRVTGDLNNKVKRVAVLGGSGEDFIREASSKGADVYITGDMTFHESQDAWQMGLNIIDPGHHIEKVMKPAVKAYLDNYLKKMGSSVEVITSKENTEPFQFM